MSIWSILRTFGVIYGHLVYLLAIWYIFPSFGKHYREKSGNPDGSASRIEMTAKHLSTHLPTTLVCCDLSVKMHCGCLLENTLKSRLIPSPQ
jgi:hypothetical protein